MENGAGQPLGERVRWLRRRARLTQYDLSELAGISVRAVRDIEQGRVRRPRTVTLARLGGALGLDGDDAWWQRRPRQEPRPGPNDLPGIGILGPLYIRRDGAVTDVQAPKLRLLLALLALRFPQAAGFEEITQALWPDGPPRSHQGLIYTYVSQLRGLMRSGEPSPGPLELARTHGGYRLVTDRAHVDRTRFEDLVARTREARTAGRAAEALALTRRALDRWHGSLLADVPQLRQDPAAVAVAGLRVESVLAYADLAMELRRPRQALHTLRSVAREEPLHEGLQARLMLVLASCGEQSEALGVFACVRRRLMDELGVEPGDEIRRAHLRVLRQQLPWPDEAEPPARRHREPPSAPVRHAAPSQLPNAAGVFVGRAAPLAELSRRLLPDPRAAAGRAPVTLVSGQPGVGKTALAVRWAHRMRDRFPDGQLYADLRGHSVRRAVTAHEALRQFLRALAVPDGQVPADVDEAAALYRSQLAGRRMLVVLDDARDEDQVRPLIPGGGHSAVLVTSRARMPGLVARDGARRMDLGVLTSGETYALLAELLGRERVDAEPAAAAALGMLCGGLPLALRVAAARMAESPGADLAQYCAKLRESGVFHELDGADLPSSLRFAFDASHAALPEPSRRLLRLLGMTPGLHVTVGVAAELAGSPPDEARRMLRGLVDASLLEQRARDRFVMPDLLRGYVAELAERREAVPSDQY
ncbi:BTAD domain-containing putative transcriptional regulator [Actinomadura rubrisoli]|uniref:Helix-turn-helix domain-containing protein n=1 Tax=Actinomadura rubrisoli TaxID=2530368 RepID=A0A4R5C941_9ACTN|nr:BTAD domain-containing putative transcriptional regulator [Actinomadura rubrisoli]TDD95309.1 helix-turn-helix domain-containing protein [Actinomadura rubrisoli]